MLLSLYETFDNYFEFLLPNFYIVVVKYWLSDAKSLPPNWTPYYFGIISFGGGLNLSNFL